VAAAAATAAGGLLAGCGRFRSAAALTTGERRLVEALSDQIIPPDQDAGGREAAVVDFIDTQLRGPYGRFLVTYRQGLAGLDATSRAVHGRSFPDLAPDEQTAFLAAVEKGEVPTGVWKPAEARQFFRLVTDHCMQGYYGSPRHGGNRGAASWKMLRLDYPQVAGRVSS
jgi:gluconate 2-dehydrogenase gamma chain